MDHFLPRTAAMHRPVTLLLYGTWIITLGKAEIVCPGNGAVGYSIPGQGFYPQLDIPKMVPINTTLLRENYEGILGHGARSTKLFESFQRVKSLLETFPEKIPANITFQSFESGSPLENYLAAPITAKNKNWLEECRTSFQFWGLIGTGIPYLPEYSAREITKLLKDIGQTIYPVNAFVFGNAIVNPEDGKILGRVTEGGNPAINPPLPVIDMGAAIFALENSPEENVTLLCFLEKPDFYGQLDKYLGKITESFDTAQWVLRQIRSWLPKFFSPPAHASQGYYRGGIPTLIYPSPEATSFLGALERCSNIDNIIDLGFKDVEAFATLGSLARGLLDSSVRPDGCLVGVGLDKFEYGVPFFTDSIRVRPRLAIADDVYQALATVTLKEKMFLHKITASLTPDAMELRARYLVQSPLPAVGGTARISPPATGDPFMGAARVTPFVTHEPLSCVMKSRRSCRLPRVAQNSGGRRCAEGILQGIPAGALRKICPYQRADNGLHLQGCAEEPVLVGEEGISLEVDCGGSRVTVISKEPITNLSAHQNCGVYADGALIFGEGTNQEIPVKENPEEGHFISALEDLARYTQFSLLFSVMTTVTFAVVIIGAIYRLRGVIVPFIRDVRVGREFRRGVYRPPQDEAPVRESFQLRTINRLPPERREISREDRNIEMFRISRFQGGNNPDASHPT